jgi:hypothetical protein
LPLQPRKRGGAQKRFLHNFAQSGLLFLRVGRDPDFLLRGATYSSVGDPGLPGPQEGRRSHQPWQEIRVQATSRTLATESA